MQPSDSYLCTGMTLRSSRSRSSGARTTRSPSAGAKVPTQQTPNTSPSSHGVHARAALLTELHLALVAISDVIPAWTLQHWNDHPKRTQTGVIEMLAAAHEHCRAATVANRP
jgi:hypothetical protein